MITPQNGQPPDSSKALVEQTQNEGSQQPVPYGGYPHYPMYGEQAFAPEDQVGFEFYRYLRILLKYKRLILGVFLTVVAVSTVLTFLTTPIYRAEVTLQIDREQMNVVKVDEVTQNDKELSDPEFYQTQYELLASKSLAERVVAKLGLADDPKFNTRNQTPIGLLYDLLTLGRDIADVETKPVTKLAAATKKLEDNLTITPIRGSKLVRIAVDHPDPVFAQRIADGFVKSFISDNLDRRYDANSYARKFLEEHLAQLKSRLEVSETQLVQYAAAEGIINVDDNKNLSNSDLVAVSSKLTDVRADRVKKEQLWKQVQSSDGLNIKEIIDNPTIQDAVKLRTTMESSYQQKLSLFKPAYPEMVQLRSQIKELDRQIQIQVAAIKKSIEYSYLASKDEEDALQGQVDKGKISLADLQNKNIKYNILKREVDTNRTLYDGLLQRYKEIGIAGGVGTNNISIVDEAELPTKPRSPVLWRNILIGSVVGLLLGGLLAIGIDYLDDTFKSPEDVERELGLSVIGIIPESQKGNSVQEDMTDERSGLSEAYRSFRTSLQFATSTGLPRSLLITSSKPNEGKSTSAINLANSLTRIGLNVLLVDCDLRNASLHRQLGLNNELGLSNYLSSAKNPEEVVQSTNVKNLMVITSGPLPPNPVELLAGPKFANLLALAAESFDMVLLDGPPIMGLADAPLISSIVQSTLLVVAAGETRRSAVRVALRRLTHARGSIVGVLLNKFDFKELGYGYGYGYGEYDYHSYGTKQLSDQTP